MQDGLDGAPPYYATSVRSWLRDENFAGRWIGRRGSIDWAPRSPNLTSMDFFFWGFVKDAVYRSLPVQSLDELTARIEVAFQPMPVEMCTRACLSVENRCHHCLSVDGGNFEIFD